MSHTHAWVLVHVVFSTKERANLIPDVSELCRYITGIARAKKVTLLAAGGTSNHVHLLIALNPVLSFVEGGAGDKRKQLAVAERTRREIRLAGRLRSVWGEPITQAGGGQLYWRAEEHHRKWTFEQEFMALLRRSGASYDERYVFG